MSQNVLLELGISSETALGGAQERQSSDNIRPFPSIEQKDYFIERNGVRFAGTHLLIELWGGRNMDDPEAIEDTLCRAAIAAGATILHSHTHHFSPNGGVSGVVVLAESHISIHTWPEREFVALDVFVCGDCDPYKAIPVFREAFQPEHVHVSEHRRGLIP